MKRFAHSPVQSEKSKEQRMLSPGMASGESYSEMASKPPRPPILQGVPVPDEDHTAKTDGALRNNFTVDVLRLDGKDFRGTIRPVDALKLIFVGALKFDPQDFAGAVPGFRGNPNILFKTKKVFNIDEVFSGRSQFSFIKRVITKQGEISETYDCSIRGVREEGIKMNQRYTWVKIEGAEYQLEGAMIRKWLLNYGNLMSVLTEDKLEIDLTSEEEELYQGVDLTTGTYSIQMEIMKTIPQFLPIDGKKIKIYHRGMVKTCANCFQPGHKKLACFEERVEWMDYVDRFMLENQLDDSYYGRWMERVEDWRLKEEQKHKRNEQVIAEMKAKEKSREQSRKEAAGEIAQVLASQASQQRAEREAALERSQLSDSSGMPEQDAGAYLPKVSKTTNEDLSQSSAATPMDGHGEEVQETESDLEEVVKSLTLEEIKEIKKKRGRPSNADRDMKTKNSSVAKTTKQKKK
jgi:hypothetical protein